MILAIDCGNTHVTFGCMKDGKADRVFRLPTDRRETDFGYAARIRQVLELAGVSLNDLCGAVISCVVPQLTRVLESAVRLLLPSVEPLTVGAGVKTGLHIRINDPGTIASDLVATAVAAKETYPLPCVIVDLGTATTLTVVDGSGSFIGGTILPGAGISLNALSEEAALLPHISIRAPKKVISADTVDCMKSGILYGAAGAIDGLLDRIAEELGEAPATVVATGGMAPLICPVCKHPMILDDQLLLRGLESVWNRNRKPEAKQF